MTSQEKLFEFFYLLLQKRKITAKEAASHFAVTSRTVYRWIDSLNLAGIPIITTQGKGGGISLTENYSIDSAVFNDDEKIAIVSSLQALSNLTEGDNSSYKKASDKIKNLVKNAGDWIKIDFSPWNDVGDERKAIFETIKTAIFTSRQLSFDYFGSNSPKQSLTIHPWKIIFRGQAWYAYGFCNEKNEARFFKLSRIKNIRLLEKEISAFWSSDCEKDTGFSFNEYAGKKILHIEALVRNDSLSYLLDSVSSVKVSETEDKEWSRAVFDFPEVYWTIPMFLSFGSKLKILSPESLNQALKTEAQKMIKNS